MTTPKYYEDTITACVLSMGPRTDRVTKTGQPFQTYSATLQTIDGDQVTYSSTSYRDAQLIPGQWLCVLLRHNLKQGSETEYHPPSIYGATIQTLQDEPRIGSMVVPTSANAPVQPAVQAQVTAPPKPQPQPSPQPEPQPDPQLEKVDIPIVVPTQPWSTDTNARIAWNSAVNNANQIMSSRTWVSPDDGSVRQLAFDDYYQNELLWLAGWFYQAIMDGPSRVNTEWGVLPQELVEKYEAKAQQGGQLP